MDKDGVIKGINCLKGALITRLMFLGSNQVAIHVKLKDADIKKIIFNDVFAFDDTGIVNTEIQYFDINLLGFMNRVLVQSKGYDPEKYLQAIFINDQNSHKAELIIVIDKQAVIEI